MRRTKARGIAAITFVLAGLLGSGLAWPVEVTVAPTLTMDPNGVTPLAGVVELATDVPVRVTLRISDDAETSTIEFAEYRKIHSLPVLGLKPNRAYTIEVTLTDQEGQNLVLVPSLQAVTEPLPADFPVISVLLSNPTEMEPGFTLLDRFRRGGGEPGQTYTIIVDNQGHVVWYSTLGANDMMQLPNGNLLYREDSRGDTELVVEIDMLGNVKSSVKLQDPGLRLHHDLFLTEHGTFLSLTRETVIVEDYPTSVSDPNAPTQTAEILDNPVVEFLADGKLLNIWPMSDMLDPTRIGYFSLRSTPDGLDWAHSNAVIHDPRDDSIITSPRHQDAVVKFSRASGSLNWILGPHANWSPEFQPFLLEPIGAPFEWQYSQHAPMLTPVGTLLLFDNGNQRASPFDGRPRVPGNENYSRAVEYAIDEEKMEVRQVWEYGAQIEESLFSPTRGDADWMQSTGNVLITFSDLRFTAGVSSSDLGLGNTHSRIVEVNHNTPAQKVFDLLIFSPEPDTQITVYRSERIPSLYPRSKGQVYVATFLCGEKTTGPGSSAVPGWYATTINITNPDPEVEVCGDKYVVIANAQSEPRGPASVRVPERLGPAEAVGVSCEDIRQAFDPPLSGFIQGSLLLELIPDSKAGSKPPTLSVVGVYSAKKRTPDDATELRQWDDEVVNAVPYKAMDVTFTSGTATVPCRLQE